MLNASYGQVYSNFWGAMTDEVNLDIRCIYEDFFYDICSFKKSNEQI